MPQRAGGPISGQQVDGSGLDRADHPLVRGGQPVGELDVEIGRRGEVTPRHE